MLKVKWTVQQVLHYIIYTLSPAESTAAGVSEVGTAGFVSAAGSPAESEDGATAGVPEGSTAAESLK